MRAGAPKVLLETIQLARHIGRLGLRPVQQAVKQAAVAGEGAAIWGLKLQPVRQVLGHERTQHVLDAYFQAKDVAAEATASMSHQSWSTGLQLGADYATQALRQTGLNGRVVGPLDEHWHALKVIRALRSAEKEKASQSSAQATTVKLTPRRFVQFMREAERKKKRTRQRDPIEAYVESVMRSGSLSSIAPYSLEKKLYTDIARIVCFGFDRALFELNGTDVWGHSLHVKVTKDVADEGPGFRSRHQSRISREQVDLLVDRMLESPDLQVPAFMEGMQRQLLINCSVMVLHLIEELVSERHLQLNLLGHGLALTMEPLAVNYLGSAEDLPGGTSLTGEDRSFHVNTRAIDELVRALMAEPEMHVVWLPGAVEAELYRIAFHRMMCIGQFMLSQLRICLFGSEVRLELVSLESDNNQDGRPDRASNDIIVTGKDIRIYMSRLDSERASIEQELQRRRHYEDADANVSASAAAAAAAAARARQASMKQQMAAGSQTSGQAAAAAGASNGMEPSELHLFKQMALQDKLCRSLYIARRLEVPIEVAYRMVADIEAYPTWMPFCTTAKVTDPEAATEYRFICQVGFGIDTVMGNLGDNINYNMLCTPPAYDDKEGCRAARVVADTPAGFAYGKRLVYDWRFLETGPGQCEVRLDMFFQASNMWCLPLWDSMHPTITGSLLNKFMSRAQELRFEHSHMPEESQGQQDDHTPGSPHNEEEVQTNSPNSPGFGSGSVGASSADPNSSSAATKPPSATTSMSATPPAAGAAPTSSSSSSSSSSSMPGSFSSHPPSPSATPASASEASLVAPESATISPPSASSNSQRSPTEGTPRTARASSTATTVSTPRAPQ